MSSLSRPLHPAPPALTAALAALIVVVTLLGGCGRGAPQQPNSWEVPVNTGSNAQRGEIVIQDAVFRHQGPAEQDPVYRPGDSAEMDATIVNSGTSPDQLLSISSPIATGGAVSGPATLPPGHALATNSSPPTAAISTTSPISLRLSGLTMEIRSGLSYPVTFDFARAGAIELRVAVDTPTVPPPECQLPADGKPHSTYTAPSGAPVPPAPPPPDCSTVR